MKVVILLVVSLDLFLSSAYGEMYKWVDEKGTLHFADDLSNIPEKYRPDAEMRKAPEENLFSRNQGKNEESHRVLNLLPRPPNPWGWR